FTLRRHRGPSLDGSRVAIVGDIRHSRVARSNVKLLHALGCQLTLVGPPTLMPERLDGWPVVVSHDLDDVLGDVDVIYLLRSQRERLDEARFPSTGEYASRWGLTAERAARLKPDTLVMHPGPMNRGVEIAAEVADSSRSLVTEQVANGVAVRMAVLWSLLGSGGPFVCPPVSGRPAPRRQRRTVGRRARRRRRDRRGRSWSRCSYRRHRARRRGLCGGARPRRHPGALAGARPRGQ